METKQTTAKPQEQTQQTNSEGTFFVEVYNTCTKQKETVEVSQEIYHTYRRTEWREAKQDKSFYKHEIQFSSLSGREDIDIENFHELVDWETDVASVYEKKLMSQALYHAFSELPQDEQSYITALFFRQLTEAEYAAQIGVSQQAVSKKKRRILEKLKKIIRQRL